MSEFRVIQGCPCNKWIAPYFAIVTADAHATVNSIYRGQDAARILHKHGHSTQAELYRLYLEGKGNPANPPGFSTHELRSDGVAYPSAPRGSDLQWWQQGIDVNDDDIAHVRHQAVLHGWHMFQPYHSGTEFHHLNFRHKPRPTRHTVRRLWHLRRTLPRS